MHAQSLLEWALWGWAIQASTMSRWFTAHVCGAFISRASNMQMLTRFVVVVLSQRSVCVALESWLTVIWLQNIAFQVIRASWLTCLQIGDHKLRSNFKYVLENRSYSGIPRVHIRRTSFDENERQKLSRSLKPHPRSTFAVCRETVRGKREKQSNVNKCTLKTLANVHERLVLFVSYRRNLSPSVWNVRISVKTKPLDPTRSFNRLGGFSVCRFPKSNAHSRTHIITTSHIFHGTRTQTHIQTHPLYVEPEPGTDTCLLFQMKCLPCLDDGFPCGNVIWMLV